MKKKQGQYFEKGHWPILYEKNVVIYVYDVDIYERMCRIMNKKYLSELMEDEYLNWRGKKVIIQAPTGLGKSTFVTNRLLNYCKGRDEKILILCNRKMLRQQYWYQLVEKFESYNSFQESVCIMTYQKLAEYLRCYKSLEACFKEYDMICLDEVHYFYQDSDFNGFGTFVLFQAIVLAGLCKTMIFMSATIECIEYEIRRAYSENTKFFEKCFPTTQTKTLQNFQTIVKYDYSWLMDYSYLKCYYVPDIETICQIVARSEAKSILFIDDIKKAQELRESILHMSHIKEGEVIVLNADNIDNGEQNEVVKTLALGNRLMPKILITTSVLDNGISVHDPDVENLVILTESKVSFLQMLGRVRKESGKAINLYFVEQSPEYYEKRERQGEYMMNVVKNIEFKDLSMLGNDILSVLWEECDKELASAYRKFITIGRNQYLFLDNTNVKIMCYYGNSRFVLNTFAKNKIGDLYLVESKFHKLARQNPKQVMLEQLKWIDKSEDELIVLKSNFKEERQAELREKFLQVKEFSVEQLSDFKENISKEYRGDILKDYLDRTRSFSNNKLELILEMFNLKLVKSEVDGKIKYTICL